MKRAVETTFTAATITSLSAGVWGPENHSVRGISVSQSAEAPGRTERNRGAAICVRAFLSEYKRDLTGGGCIFLPAVCTVDVLLFQ